MRPTSTNGFSTCLLGLSMSLAAAATAATAPSASPDTPADTIYINGYIYTVDAHDAVKEALAVRDGRIAYVGTTAAAKAMSGPATHIIDLHGRMLMPGLVDGHMHPLEGGIQLLKCNLHYKRLTVAQYDLLRRPLPRYSEQRHICQFLGEAGHAQSRSVLAT
jgi:hypothetical protein